MLFSPDFLHFFEATAVLLERDPSLWCVSTWNDNGLKSYDWDSMRMVWPLLLCASAACVCGGIWLDLGGRRVEGRARRHSIWRDGGGGGGGWQGMEALQRQSSYPGETGLLFPISGACLLSPLAARAAVKHLQAFEAFVHAFKIVALN